MLPREIKRIIFDYYYSHKMFVLKKKLFRELQFNDFFRQIRCFYEVYHHITLSVLPVEE